MTLSDNRKRVEKEVEAERKRKWNEFSEWMREHEVPSTKDKRQNKH